MQYSAAVLTGQCYTCVDDFVKRRGASRRHFSHVHCKARSRLLSCKSSHLGLSSTSKVTQLDAAPCEDRASCSRELTSARRKAPSFTSNWIETKRIKRGQQSLQASGKAKTDYKLFCQIALSLPSSCRSSTLTPGKKSLILESDRLHMFDRSAHV